MRDIELEMKIQKSLNEGNNVWVVGDNLYGNAWIKKVSGDVKTKSEAQAIVDAEVTAAQTAYDALPMCCKYDRNMKVYGSKSD